MTRFHSNSASVFLGLLIFLGCRQPADHPPARLQLKVLFAASYCRPGGRTPSALWFENLQQAKAALGRGKIPARLSPKRGLLFISMGRQPSGGFAISLARPTAELKNDTAIVDVIWHNPPPDSMVTQAITFPCLLLEMEKADFHTITVRDQEGHIRARASTEKNL